METDVWCREEKAFTQLSTITAGEMLNITDTVNGFLHKCSLFSNLA